MKTSLRPRLKGPLRWHGGKPVCRRRRLATVSSDTRSVHFLPPSISRPVKTDSDLPLQALRCGRYRRRPRGCRGMRSRSANRRSNSPHYAQDREPRHMLLQPESRRHWQGHNPTGDRCTGWSGRENHRQGGRSVSSTESHKGTCCLGMAFLERILSSFLTVANTYSFIYLGSSGSNRSEAVPEAYER